jgi:hypothetical protein
VLQLVLQLLQHILLVCDAVLQHLSQRCLPAQHINLQRKTTHKVRNKASDDDQTATPPACALHCHAAKVQFPMLIASVHIHLQLSKDRE